MQKVYNGGSSLCSLTIHHRPTTYTHVLQPSMIYLQYNYTIIVLHDIQIVCLYDTGIVYSEVFYFCYKYINKISRAYKPSTP